MTLLSACTLKERFKSLLSHILIFFLNEKKLIQNAEVLRKWLNGRARPCQGRCCGFDSRFPLLHYKKQYWIQLLRRNLRKWLNGRARPCQGRCCGFDSRFPLDDEAIWIFSESLFYLQFISNCKNCCVKD